MSARSEIETRVINWAKAQVPPVPVAIEGVAFTRPNGPYVEVNLLGSNNLSRGVSAEGITTYGMFQITCFALANKGMGEVERLRDNIVALFPVLPKTGTVSIEAPLSWSGSDVMDGYTYVPVRGNYRIET